MTPTRNRRWFRWSLRTLFVVVTAVAVGLFVCRPVTVAERHPRFPSVANQLPNAVDRMDPRYVDISWNTRAPTVWEMTKRSAVSCGLLLALLAPIGIWRVWSTEARTLSPGPH